MRKKKSRKGRPNGLSRLIDLCFEAGNRGVPTKVAQKVAGKGIQSRIAEFHKVQSTFRFVTKKGKITIHRIENIIFDYKDQYPEYHFVIDGKDVIAWPAKQKELGLA
jgi:hypothetical protein